MQLSARFFLLPLLGAVLMATGQVGASGNSQEETKQSADARFKGLAHICIYTKDLQKSVHFYTENLAFRVEYQTLIKQPRGSTKYVSLRQGSCIIELLEPSNPDRVKENLKGSIDHFALEVTDLDKVVQDLKVKGVAFDTEILDMPWLFKGVKGAFLHGPSGESIELFQYVK
jgi:catechol 2,3-dioxygenase-like lactoylglutathione lyase family enzyme